MGVTATVSILPGAAVNHKRSYASYPQSRADSRNVLPSIPRAPHLAARILTPAGGSKPDSSAHAGILRTARPALDDRPLRHGRAPLYRAAGRLQGKRSCPCPCLSRRATRHRERGAHYASDRSWPGFIFAPHPSISARSANIERCEVFRFSDGSLSDVC